MILLGLVLSLAASAIYSLRYSFIKDLGKHAVPNTQVNFLYRAISFPFILLVIFVLQTDLFEFGDNFLVSFAVALTLNVGYGLYAVYLFQKHRFSSVESLKFLNIIFSAILGTIFFKEILRPNEIAGIGIIVGAFCILALSERKVLKKNTIPFFEIIFYYFFGSLIDLANKQAINESSPMSYTVYLTAGLIIVNLLLAVKGKHQYKFEDKKANLLLVLVGVCAAFSFIGMSFGYKLLPLGVVTSIIAANTFLSLWISHKKYEEDDLKGKLVASVVAFIGILILFLF